MNFIWLAQRSHFRNPTLKVNIFTEGFGGGGLAHGWVEEK
jgi:hypothetical protein